MLLEDTDIMTSMTMQRIHPEARKISTAILFQLFPLAA
jgi:hypothetical protein